MGKEARIHTSTVASTASVTTSLVAATAATRGATVACNSVHEQGTAVFIKAKDTDRHHLHRQCCERWRG